MKTLKQEDYTINVCTDIIEWAKEFYGMPDDSKLANEDEVSGECMGFSQIDTKTIWIFVPKEYDLKDLKETIAHEIGHITEIPYPINPEQTDINDDIHEMKADYYMNFYIFVDKIVSDVLSESIKQYLKSDVLSESINESTIAMQEKCIYCSREQYKPIVWSVSHGECPCAWCGKVPPIMTIDEYKNKIK